MSGFKHEKKDYKGSSALPKTLLIAFNFQTSLLQYLTGEAPFTPYQRTMGNQYFSGVQPTPSPASRTPSMVSSPMGNGRTFTASGRPLKDIIVLAPCGADEVLPMNADMPADLFTSCLLTPMPIALRWFVKRNRVGLRFE